MKYVIRFSPVFIFLLLLNTQNAYAYLDPGTGSYILQILIASLLGAAFAVKIFWQKITTSLKKIFSKNAGEQTNDPE
ncbi:hypothetical protein JXQ31_06835 [candidate division KSB1 bacterium]|nr:hypothetical protein [candidate division KSB1 bacterium]